MCQWLLDPGMPEDWKPNKCKFVIDAKEHSLVVHPDPGARRPWLREPFLSHLFEMASRNIGRGATVLVMERGNTIVILPDRFVELGRLSPDDRIGVARVMTPAGPQWQARVAPADQAAQLAAQGRAILRD